MNTSDCRQAEKWIVTDLDEGLSEEARELLEKHLEQCDSCRRMKNETARLFSALASDVPPEPNEEFWREFETSLEARIRSNYPQNGSRNRWKAAALALAAGLAFLAVWVGYFDPFGSRTSHNEAALPTVIEELNRVYGPMSEESDELLVSSETTLTAANGLGLRADTVAEWVATEYDPLMLWL